MRIKVINWTWEEPDAQQAFAELVGFPDPQKTREELDQIETFLQLRPPLHVLDVGCGTGRHTLELARRGYQVVGIDVAQSFLAQAQAEAQRQSKHIEFRLQRAAELQESAVYDIALAYNHTLGFMSDSELAQHFSAIRTALKPGGRLLLVLAGPKLTPNGASESSKGWIEKGEKLILSEKWLEKGYRIERCIVIDKQNDEIVEYRERQRAFSLGDVQWQLEAIGFQVTCMKDLEGHPATPQEFGVFVCHKA